MNLQAEIRPELWQAVAKPYESELYKSAVLEAIHYLSNVLRERAGVEGDGASLVGQALSGNDPRLRINKLQTETEKDEQKGLEQILRGLYQGIRNPRSHEQIEDAKSTADAIIVFIDYLLGIVGRAKEPFTIEEWGARVFDPEFFADPRYVELLVSEVPAKKRSEALITIYREKGRGDEKKLPLIFSALIELVGDDQFDDFLAAVSDELKVVQGADATRVVLRILPPRLWPRIDKSARLRIENKLIGSIRDGKVDPDTGQSYVVTGNLGTWAQDFAKYFELKKELFRELSDKLERTHEEQCYVGKFFLQVLPDTVPDYWPEGAKRFSTVRCIDRICKIVSEPLAPPFFRDAFLRHFCDFPTDWQDLFLEKLEPLKESDSEYYQSIVEMKNGIPF